MSGALMVANTYHSVSGIAIIMPLEVSAMSLATSYIETSSSTVRSPYTPRNAANTTANTLVRPVYSGSNSRHVVRSMRISRTTHSCPLHAKGYATSQTGSAFNRSCVGRWTRERPHTPSVSSSHRLLHLFQPNPVRFRARITCRRIFFSTQSRPYPEQWPESPIAKEAPHPRRIGLLREISRSMGWD
jgi:hypothetical protein